MRVHFSIPLVNMKDVFCYYLVRFSVIGRFSYCQI